jgi:glycosyltransferase involved in cell wall biosynthesis
MKITALIITKNEEQNIGGCLDSVKWMDDRVVVDACSTDRTVEIAKGMGARVFTRPWPGYGAQRNFSLEQASTEWVFVIDADERVTPELRSEIEIVLRQPSPEDVAAYEVPRRNYFYGKWIRYGGIYPDYTPRLFRRSLGRYGEVPLHEPLLLNGKAVRLQSPLDHYSMPTIGGHVRKMMRYTSLGADDKLKRRAWVSALDIAGNHLVTAFKTYVLKQGWRDGVHGIVVAGFAGLHTFVKYAKSWERLHAAKPDCAHSSAGVQGVL